MLTDASPLVVGLRRRTVFQLQQFERTVESQFYFNIFVFTLVSSCAKSYLFYTDNLK